MFLEPKNKINSNYNHSVQLKHIKNLHFRATLLKNIRKFFQQRNVLEVDTPALYPSTVPCLQIESFRFSKDNFTSNTSYSFQNLYLQTSPEFAMKRLLANNSGDIYQICKAWRYDEKGRLHNLEFTILEWYRVNYNHHQLMHEMDELLQTVANTKPAQKYSYAEIFLMYLDLDINNLSTVELAEYAQSRGIDLAMSEEDSLNLDKDDWLNLLLSYLIEPQLGQNHCPTFIYDYPASMSALAKIRCDKKNINIDKQNISNNTQQECIYVAERFEVYLNGIELANGFHELNNSYEQRQRFLHELEQRQQHNLHCPPLDEDLLNSLDLMPNCSGVALGIDRLLMILTDANTIEEVLFTI